jgi:excisionase family DNA binding protein
MEEVVRLEPLALSKGSAGKALDCSLSKIQQLVHAGKLKTIKIGADDRVTVASLKAYVESGGDAVKTKTVPTEKAVAA